MHPGPIRWALRSGFSRTRHSPPPGGEPGDPASALCFLHPVPGNVGVVKKRARALSLVFLVAALALVLWQADAVPRSIPGRPALASAAFAPPAEPLAALAIPAGSAACAAGGTVDAGATLARSLQSGGLARTYRVHVSARATGGQSMPVVLNFHGRGGTGAAIEQYSGLLPVSDREGFLLVSPDGTGSPAGWSAGASLPGWPVDDVQFVRDLLQTLEKDFCVDATRVYAVGHSNGAFMASRLACDLPGQIAAIVPVAGIYVPPEGCPAPVPVLAFHGTADDVVPFGGGPVRGTYRYPGAEQELAAWAQADHCHGGSTKRDLGPRLVLESAGQCAAPVEMVLVKGGGHEWPAAASPLDTATLAWDFLKTYRAPAN